jgi:hypothetical protein
MRRKRFKNKESVNMKQTGIFFLVIAVIIAITSLAAISAATVTYQAENASFGGGAVTETSNSGYLGTAYLNFPTTGGYVQFYNVDGGTGGAATLQIRNALGVTSSRTGRYQVNGGTWVNITFSPTGSWTTWNTMNVSVTLNSGAGNTIRFESTGQDLANIDQLTVVSGGSSTPTPTQRVTPTPTRSGNTPTPTRRANTPTPTRANTPTPTITQSGNTYYVSPSGSDSNPGTISSPFKTIQKADSVATAGTTILLRGGTHAYSSPINLNKSGSSGKLIKLWAYPGETVVIDFSGESYSNDSKGIVLKGSYWHFKGFQFKNSGDNGIYITTGNNILEQLVAYGHKDTGIQIYGSGAYNNQVINCDSYDNYDPNTGGGKADGFGCKTGIGTGNIFRGCRAWHNSDDGFDFWQTTVRIDIINCWAFDNGYDGGNGNGIKLGGDNMAGNIYVANCMVFNQPNKGFDQNHNLGAHTLYNNIAWKCGAYNFSLGEAPNSGKHVLKNNISFDGKVSIYSSSTQEKNSWQGFTVNSGDFQSLDTSFAKAARKSDGSLPDVPFLHLVQGSDLVNAGVNVGLPYNGSAPDLGPFETNY